MSAENEQNASEVQDVSENELEQLSKAARQKYETKNEYNRYKQQTRARTTKAPAKIEFVEDKSDTVTSTSESLIQYKKIKAPMPNLHEYKKKEPKYEDLMGESKQDLDLLTDETTTRQQKRWKKKESGGERLKQDRQKITSTTKRHIFRKKTTKQLNFDDDGLSFQLVHRNDNDTNNNRPSHSPSSDVPYNSQNNDMYNRQMKSNEQSAFRQHDRDSRQDTFKHNEKYKTKYRSEKEDKHAQKVFNEPYEYDPADTPKYMPMYDLVDAPMVMPMVAPIEHPLEINFNGGKVLETTKGHNSVALSPKVNAFNIDGGGAGLERSLDSKRKNFIVATSGNVVLPAFAANANSAARRFYSKTTVA